MGIIGQEVKLTQEEAQWLNGHEITLGFLMNYPPFIYNGESSYEAIGIIPDIHRAIESSIGESINLRTAEWQQLQIMLQEGTIDGIYGLRQKNIQDFGLLDGGFFLSSQRGLYGKNRISSPSELSGSTIAILANSNNLYFLEERPDINMITYSTIEGISQALINDQVDYVILMQSMGEILSRESHGEIMLAYPELAPHDAHIGVNPEYPLSASILKKAIESYDQEFYSRIETYWYHQRTYGDYQIPLTDEERQWLTDHRTITVGIDENWPPLEYYDGDQIQGISYEYLQTIEDMLDITFEIIPAPWQETYENFQQGELDMLSCLQELPERHEIMNFTNPYITMPFALVSRSDFNYYGDLNKLRNISIGVLGSPASLSLMQENYPDVDFVTFRELQLAIDALQAEEIQAFAGTFQTLVYRLAQGGYYDLQVIGQLPVGLELSMGVRKDWTILTTILNKALNHIPHSQREEIQRKWIYVNIQKELNYQLLWRIASLFSIALLLLIVWIVLLTRRERKRREQWMETKRMESLGRMAGGVAHDFKNILMGISGYTELISDSIENGASKEYLNELLNSVDQGTELVNQILIYSNPDKMQKSPINFQKILDHTQRFLNSINKINAEIEVELNEVPEFHGDKTQIQQLLSNLCFNAIQAMDHQESPKLRIVILLEEVRIIPFIQIIVQDNGSGIPQEIKEKIFDPYFTTKDIGKGTGLGLATVRRIVENHRGSIHVESESDTGTLFIISLPVE